MFAYGIDRVQIQRLSMPMALLLLSFHLLLLVLSNGRLCTGKVIVPLQQQKEKNKFFFLLISWEMKRI